MSEPPVVGAYSHAVPGLHKNAAAAKEKNRPASEGGGAWAERAPAGARHGQSAGAAQGR